MTTPGITHIEVTVANRGTEVLGIEDGQLLTVLRETKCFFFVKSFAGRELKVSKQTKRLCWWGNPSTSPVFNI